MFSKKTRKNLFSVIKITSPIIIPFFTWWDKCAIYLSPYTQKIINHYQVKGLTKIMSFSISIAIISSIGWVITLYLLKKPNTKKLVHISGISWDKEGIPCCIYDQTILAITNNGLSAKCPKCNQEYTCFALDKNHNPISLNIFKKQHYVKEAIQNGILKF